MSSHHSPSASPCRKPRATQTSHRRLQDTTAQIRVRAAFLLLIGFTALAESVGLETILGAFAAGALLSLLDRDEMTTHPQFRLKLEAVGFGSSSRSSSSPAA
jgi:Kef-type K+ transport system membrane component KefB